MHNIRKVVDEATAQARAHGVPVEAAITARYADTAWCSYTVDIFELAWLVGQFGFAWINSPVAGFAATVCLLWYGVRVGALLYVYGAATHYVLPLALQVAAADAVRVGVTDGGGGGGTNGTATNGSVTTATASTPAMFAASDACVGTTENTPIAAVA